LFGKKDSTGLVFKTVFLSTTDEIGHDVVIDFSLHLRGCKTPVL
jgi:hypothetical protein